MNLTVRANGRQRNDPLIPAFAPMSTDTSPDHTTLLGPRQANRIGEHGMSVAGWIGLLERAGFDLIDVLLRDAEQVVIGALKSIDPDRH